MAKRYDTSYTVWLSSKEDAKLIRRIETTYGNSRSERARNFCRAAAEFGNCKAKEKRK